jgi:multiple sugar transport system substrate-binding protein
MSIKIPLYLALGALVLMGAGCFGSSPPPEPVTLAYWRYDSRASDLDAIIEAYRRLHPHVSVDVTVKPAEDYEQDLLTAIATGAGPDLFSLPNTSLADWRTRILPLPAEVTIPTQAVNDDREIVWDYAPKPTVTLRQYRDYYLENVVGDLTWEQLGEDNRRETRIWGVALSHDNLALFTNDDLLRKAGFTEPPDTWAEFQAYSQRMTALDADGDVLQAGAAFGGSSANVAYATEIVAALMAQNGADLADEDGPAFARHTQQSQGQPLSPGAQALSYYQTYRNRTSRNYTWNAAMPNSIDAFVEGRVAMIVAYPTDRAIIAERAPRLNFSVGPLPQVSPNDRQNIARYPAELVSARTAHGDLAWDFLQFAADPDNVAGYLEATKRPTAALGLIDAQNLNPDIAPFSGQALITRSWYRGKRYDEVVGIFDRMIDWVPTLEKPSHQNALNDAQSAVAGTYD